MPCQGSHIQMCRVQEAVWKNMSTEDAEPPVDKVLEELPFTYDRVGIFHPFLVKADRKTQRRYGEMFTCLSSREAHIETTSNLTTDSYIQALRRLIIRRGNVRRIRSDNGINFFGTSIEPRTEFGEMDEKRINDFMMELGGEWISCKSNPPMSSNMGGVWE